MKEQRLHNADRTKCLCVFAVAPVEFQETIRRNRKRSIGKFSTFSHNRRFVRSASHAGGKFWTSSPNAWNGIPPPNRTESSHSPDRFPIATISFCAFRNVATQRFRSDVTAHIFPHALHTHVGYRNWSTFSLLPNVKQCNIVLASTTQKAIYVNTSSFGNS